ncbi:hypothetical protein [Streptomyces pseudovenezuelae]|uniref:hypothetical protein n=1 Tax=Streptomyces pseudovenezuelae TaxID=67350 RepID=UPI002E7FC550|nr:hypothetical protein [Streptomyces pseudovenezuelae]WUA94512.1 hypothetical protein OHO81_44870 [Streptomyces pseudovenezuelae]
MFVTVVLFVIVCLLAVAIPLVVRACRRANRKVTAILQDELPAPTTADTPAPKETPAA